MSESQGIEVRPSTENCHKEADVDIISVDTEMWSHDPSEEDEKTKKKHHDIETATAVTHISTELSSSSSSKELCLIKKRHLCLLVATLLLLGMAMGMGLGFSIHKMQENENALTNQALNEASKEQGTESSPPLVVVEDQDVGEEHNDDLPVHDVDSVGSSSATTATTPTIAPRPIEQEETTSPTTSNTATVDSSSSTATTSDSMLFAPDAEEWPFLVGMDGTVAAQLLEEAYPGQYIIQIVTYDSMISMDLDPYRIRIFVDEDTNIVMEIPMVG
mmetsp:Transcript_6211/g.10716  ORF Transcript_6211/g.10716 Transcript_6211/m.10716 type:complete len:274 (+) Transcript_6211:73-894(+)